MNVSIIGLNDTKDILLISKKEYDNIINTKAELDKVKVSFPPEGNCTLKYRIVDDAEYYAEYKKRLSLVSMLIEELSFLEKENKSLHTENNNLKVKIDNLKLVAAPNEHEKVINEGLLENKEDHTKEEIKEEQVQDTQPVKKRSGRPKGKKLYEGYD